MSSCTLYDTLVNPCFRIVVLKPPLLKISTLLIEDLFVWDNFWVIQFDDSLESETSNALCMDVS